MLETSCSKLLRGIAWCTWCWLSFAVLVASTADAVPISKSSDADSFIPRNHGYVIEGNVSIEAAKQSKASRVMAGREFSLPPNASLDLGAKAMVLFNIDGDLVSKSGPGHIRIIGHGFDTRADVYFHRTGDERGELQLLSPKKNVRYSVDDLAILWTPRDLKQASLTLYERGVSSPIWHATVDPMAGSIDMSDVRDAISRSLIPLVQKIGFYIIVMKDAKGHYCLSCFSARP